MALLSMVFPSPTAPSFRTSVQDCGAPPGSPDLWASAAANAMRSQKSEAGIARQVADALRRKRRREANNIGTPTALADKCPPLALVRGHTSGHDTGQVICQTGWAKEGPQAGRIIPAPSYLRDVVPQIRSVPGSFASPSQLSRRCDRKTPWIRSSPESSDRARSTSAADIPDPDRPAPSSALCRVSLRESP